MATPFSDVYEKFLSLITDDELAKLTDEDLQDTLFDYMDTAIALDFKQCKKDLSNMDKTLQQFNVDLTREETLIISYAMVLSWCSPKLKHEEKLKEKIGDRDYKLFSSANLLKELKDLEEKTRKQLRTYILSYTYNDFIKYGE